MDIFVMEADLMGEEKINNVLDKMYVWNWKKPWNGD
jgi:hypothetical protein